MYRLNFDKASLYIKISCCLLISFLKSFALNEHCRLDLCLHKKNGIQSVIWEMHKFVCLPAELSFKYIRKRFIMTHWTILCGTEIGAYLCINWGNVLCYIKIIFLIFFENILNNNIIYYNIEYRRNIIDNIEIQICKSNHESYCITCTTLQYNFLTRFNFQWIFHK